MGNLQGANVWSAVCVHSMKFDEAVSDWVVEGMAVDIVYLHFKNEFDDIGTHGDC